MITWVIRFTLMQWSEIFLEKVMMVQNKIMMVQLFQKVHYCIHRSQQVLSCN